MTCQLELLLPELLLAGNCALMVDMAPLVSSVERHHSVEVFVLIVVMGTATKWRKVPFLTMVMVALLAAKCAAAQRRWLRALRRLSEQRWIIQCNNAHRVRLPSSHFFDIFDDQLA